MALVTCPDCRVEVSDQAPACVRCGRPMREPTVVQTPARPKATTIEQTGKSYKAHQLFGAIVLIVGVIALAGNDSGSPAPALLMTIGLLWFIGARIGAWWGHG